MSRVLGAVPFPSFSNSRRVPLMMVCRSPFHHRLSPFFLSSLLLSSAVAMAKAKSKSTSAGNAYSNILLAALLNPLKVPNLRTTKRSDLPAWEDHPIDITPERPSRPSSFEFSRTGLFLVALHAFLTQVSQPQRMRWASCIAFVSPIDDKGRDRLCSPSAPARSRRLSLDEAHA